MHVCRIRKTAEGSAFRLSRKEAGCESPTDAGSLFGTRLNTAILQITPGDI